jgi:aminoglycoside phosphotransferase family enzyme
VWSDQFLKSHAARLQQRIDRGFIRDVHGDLHSRNIFLYRKPVLFDCIEFNDPMRQIDVLYEIAFLCMDLEAYGQKNLSRYFLTEYKKKFKCFECKEDESLFIYYKCLRANVRAKVNVMSATQADTSEELHFHSEEAKKYLLLMSDYMKEISAD